MKILFTGCSGFIGGAALNGAVKKYGQENVCAFSSVPIKNVKTVIHNGYEFEQNIFIEHGLSDIEVIVHIGAFTPKDQAEANDIKKCDANIYNTEKLLFSEFPDLKKIIFLSTLDVYASAGIISEETAECPVSLYGFSKLYCEKMIGNFSGQRNVLHQILRLGHVYGPGEEKYKKIIPVAILNLLRNNFVELFGDGQAIRTFIYIDDVVTAILNAIDLPKPEGIINIVGDEQITIENLVQTLITIHSNKDAVIRHTPVSGKNRNLIFDNTKLKEKLLNQFTSITAGLRKEYVYLNGIIANEHIL